jgi:hypothetical protein
MFGYIVLYSFPLFVFVLFRRTRKDVALVTTLIVGYLLLPERLAFDLPLIPALNKDTIPVLAAVAALLVMSRDQDGKVLPGWLPKNWMLRIFILALLIGTYLTVSTNGDTIVIGITTLPAMTIYDAVSLVLGMVTTLLPFLLARKFLAYPPQQRTILVALVLAGALYSFLALYEVRMSPQLNNIIYGFFPHSFLQHIRGDGFRPLVFLNHGLWLAIFFSMSCLAAIALFRISPGAEKGKYLILGLWILFTLILSKSLGALLITLGLLPVIFLGRRFQLMVASVVAVIVILYPILRGVGLVPLEQILQWASSIDPARAFSLEYRLLNEEILLEKAQERPVFGWGMWGRSFTYDEVGNRTSVTDGYWIIILGVGGWIKYIAEFGLLCSTIVLMFFRKTTYDLGLETTLLTLLLTANIVDLIPNATITPITWMIAGALWGRLELGKLDDERPVEAKSSNRSIRYSRFPGQAISSDMSEGSMDHIHRRLSQTYRTTKT